MDDWSQLDLFVATAEAGSFSAVAQLGDVPSGVLRLAAPTGLAPYLLTPHLPAFLARYPKIEMRISPNDAVMDFVANGFDLCLRMGHLKDTSLVARRIATSQSVVCASPGYFARVGSPSHPNELGEHQCLSYRTRPGPSIWRFNSPEGVVEVSVNGRLRVDNGQITNPGHNARACALSAQALSCSQGEGLRRFFD